MAITRQKKQDILSKLEGVVKDSSTMVFVGFTGLKVPSTTAMRATLREKGVGFFVAKKTLLGRAFGAENFEGEMPALDGEIAIAYSADQMAPAQSIREFEKQFKDQISIVGGVFGGTYKSKEEMVEIASIPALPVLRGMFVNVINSPIQGTVLALNAIAEKKS